MGNPDWSEGQEDAEIERNLHPIRYPPESDSRKGNLQEALGEIKRLRAENVNLKRKLRRKK